MHDAWVVEHIRARAGALHAREPEVPARPRVWVADVVRSALVLGSTQPRAQVDEAACSASGVDIVRRRSGGGAVLVVPGEGVWVDVVLPRRSQRWEPDVSRSAHWLGQVWADALADLGVEGPSVHTGALSATPWTPLVCFAGLAPGEVHIGGAKVVGISQRRTREWARFQCSVPRYWDPDHILALLSLSVPERAQASASLATMAAGVDHPADEVVDAFLARLGGPQPATPLQP